MLASSLASMRRLSDRQCVNPCSVTRGGNPLSPVPTMPDGTPLRCEVAADSAEVSIPGGSPFEKLRRWRITFPDGTPVAALDRVAALNSIYSVVEIAHDESISVSTTVYAIQLYGPDSGGNPTVPVYLRANCVIAIDRATGGNDGHVPTTQATSIPARWQAPSSEMLQALGDSALPALYVDPGVDLRQGDGVTISSGVGYSPLPPFLAVRYPVRFVSPTLGAIPMTMAHLDAKVAQ